MSPIFSPSPQELAIVSQIFASADPSKLGVITGDAALKIFAGTKLSPIVLSEIWDIADQDNKGWLSKKNVAVAVRLISWAQKGEKVSADLLSKRASSSPNPSAHRPTPPSGSDAHHRGHHNRRPAAHGHVLAPLAPANSTRVPSIDSTGQAEVPADVRKL